MNQALQKVGQPVMSTDLTQYRYSGFDFGEEMNRNAVGGPVAGEAQIGGAIKNLVINLNQSVASDTPTMPQWGLIVMTVLLIWAATRHRARPNPYSASIARR